MVLDTIGAISTPYGTAGISMIRITGEEAITKVNRIFQGPNLTKVKSHTLHYGFILDKDKKPIDEVMVSILRGPKSFTTENMVEISTHGGILVTQKVLKRILEVGIRLARPGEFTERAFVHGRIDLAESEAVMDLISARSDKAMKLALNALKGETTKLINDLREQLLNILAVIEVNIDYPEYDDVEELTNQTIKPLIKEYVEKVEEILAESNKGRLIREGVNTAIVGKPNVGKSSLLNALLDEERAIVTDIAGTTRDTIEVAVNVGGIILNLIDTAGIRETKDIIEKIGVQRSKQTIENAELVILVLDASETLSQEDENLLELTENKQRIIVGNKKDLGPKLKIENMVLLSALKKEGIKTLEKAIIEELNLADIGDDFNYLSNIRHINKLEETKDILTKSLEAIDFGYPIDVVEIDLKQAWQKLGEIIGDYHPEDLIDELFSKFCLGK
ncbi:MAG: tRNA uridine-5-carboxymethylaminomethyl(34) synthesis GTPase MnmE [Acholeplasmataceae bacterium]|jgi:tRNA modification GTPase|nr:tRNA uridine-5-carboxymethylaminomethyl(34) synthesis GTPase MnmE [Acholeplasmataceae bacterium]